MTTTENLDRKDPLVPARASAFLAGDDQQFRRLVDSVTDHAIFMLDPDGLIVTWNSGAERLKGYRAEEVIGKHFSLFYTPDATKQALPSRALEIAAKVGRYEEDGWRVRKNGALFWANVVISAIHDDTGALSGFAKVTRDLTERRKAEMALREQSRRLTAILDCLSDAVSVCDSDGKFVHRNRAALKLAGPGWQDGDGIPETTQQYELFRADGVTPFPPAEHSMLQALKGESSDDVEVVMRHPAHPEAVCLTVSTRPLVDESRGIVGAVVVAHDITRRTLAERGLARQTALLRSVLDCVVEMVAVFDATGRLILSNPAFDRMVGKTFAAAPQVDERRAHYGLFAADGKRKLSVDEAPANRAMRGETVADLEVVIRSATWPDGRVVSTNAQQLYDSSGAVMGAVVTGRDVTERKAAERKVLEQTKLLTSILDCLGESVVVYDRVGRILMTNPAAARGMDRSMPRGSTLDERMKHYGFFSVDGVRRIQPSETAGARALQGESLDDVEFMVRTPVRPEGIAFSANARPLHDDEGNTIAAVVTARDITARKRVEREKENLLVELKRSNEELAQFAHVASHDLRAPLRAIDSLAQWLEEDLRPHFTPETAQQMRLLQSRVRRMEALIGDLLALARVGRVAAEIALVDVDALVAEVVELAAPPTTCRVVRDISVAPFETAAVSLKRTLLNLVGNAIKHHDRSDCEIRISARESGAFVEFEVADDGPGIPPAFHGKIFEAFQTLKPRDELEASGVGLAFVKKIVEDARGTVTVESTGRGATFRVAWPRRWVPGQRVP